MHLVFWGIGKVRPGARYFPAAYAYARWLDDFVDSPDIPVSQQRAELNRQIALLNRLYVGGSGVSKTGADILLCKIVEADVTIFGSRLREPIERTFETMRFDLQRKHALVSKEELDSYSEEMGGSFIQAIAIFLDVDLPDPTALRPIARAACKTYIMRDLAEDLAVGYINVPEHWANHGLSSRTLARWKNVELDRIAKDFGESFTLIAEGDAKARAFALGFLLPRYRVFQKLKVPSAADVSLSLIDRMWIAAFVGAATIPVLGPGVVRRLGERLQANGRRS